MELGVSGKVVVVTGASGGIGRAIAQAFLSEGATVAAGYHRNRDALEQLCQQEGGQLLPFQVDVADPHSVEAAFAEVARTYGRLNAVVNCAGVATFGPTASFSEAAWKHVIETNLTGTFHCCRAAIPHFQRIGSGDIVNVSSSAAQIGSFEGVAYAASKGGIDALTRSLALELAQMNVRVNAVSPGRIGTSMRRATSGQYVEFMLAQTPMGRVGQPEEVARTVVFLASRATEFLTGEVISVTGGLRSVFLKHVDPDV